MSVGLGMSRLASSITFAVVAVVFAVSTPSIAGPINLITNGSFELGANDPGLGGFAMLGVGSTDLTGWSITQNNIDWDNAFWQAADGTHSLDLNGQSRRWRCLSNNQHRRWSNV